MSTIELTAERCLQEKIQSREALIGIVQGSERGAVLSYLAAESSE